MTNWINPKIIIGNAATGDYYFDRPRIVADIWDGLNKGNHVLVAAPRRVGKTSIMKHMADHCADHYRCVFKNVQGINTAAGFYEVVYALIKSCLSKKQKTTTWLADFFREIKIEEISLTGGLKLGDKPIDHLEAIEIIMSKLNGHDYSIVLFIDELPEVLHYLFRHGKEEDAQGILKNLRRWRQEDKFRHLKFVLAGSVGIHYVIKTITGRVSDKNDFHEVKFVVLTQSEAEKYLDWATIGATVQYTPELKACLLSKVQHYLPYFISLMLDEINRAAMDIEDPVLAKKHIDNAFNSIVKNSDHFRDWKNRLFDYMPAADAAFLNEVLTFTAHIGSISLQKLHDLAVDHKKKHTYMELLDGIERDGYVTEQGDTYIFISPFLQAFWKRDNPVI